MEHIVSGIQPTGQLNIGTYLGSIKNFVRLQKKHHDARFFLFIADLHAITVPQERLKLRRTIKELAALYLACGLQKDNLALFVQSEVREHSEIAHLLQCHAYIGELERMTQYKDKAQRQTAGVSAALFTYPVLMAGDILLYDAAHVPVGEDQLQHLELTRDIAMRMNNRYGNVFTVPKPLLPEIGERIMSLSDPHKKMSKSDDNVKSKVLLLDEEKVIRKRILSAVTDSEPTIRFDKEEKPGISNLLTIFSALSERPIKDLEATYQGASYQTFKTDLADCLVAELKTIQTRYHEIIDSGELDRFLDEGRESATRIAARKIEKLHKKIGLGRLK